MLIKYQLIALLIQVLICASAGKKDVDRQCATKRLRGKCKDISSKQHKIKIALHLHLTDEEQSKSDEIYDGTQDENPCDKPKEQPDSGEVISQSDIRVVQKFLAHLKSTDNPKIYPDRLHDPKILKSVLLEFLSYIKRKETSTSKPQNDNNTISEVPDANCVNKLLAYLKSKQLSADKLKFIRDIFLEPSTPAPTCKVCDPNTIKTLISGVINIIKVIRDQMTEKPTHHTTFKPTTSDIVTYTSSEDGNQEQTTQIQTTLPPGNHSPKNEVSNSHITIEVGKGSTKNVTITSSNGIGQQSTRNITVSNMTISLVSQSGQPNNSNSHMAIEVSGGSNETDPYTVTVTTVVGIGQNQRKIIRSYNKPKVLFSILPQNGATYPTNTSGSYMGIEVLRGSNKTGPYIVAITTSEGNGQQPTKTTYNVSGLLFSKVSSNGTNNSNSNMNIEVIGGSKKTDPYNVNITTSGGNGQQLTQILESSNTDNLTVSLDSLGTETNPNNNSYSLITIGVGKGSTKNVTITSSNGIGQQSTRNITVSNMTISLVSQSGQPNNSNSHMAIEVSGGSNETDPYTVTVTTVVGIGQNQRKIIRSYNKPKVLFSILQQNEATYPTNTSDSYMGIEVLRGSNKTGPYIVAITTSEGNGKQPTKTTYNVSGLLFSIVSSNGTNNSSSNMNIEVIGGSKKTDPYNVNITTIVGNDQPRTEILTSPNVKLSLDSLSGETNPTKNLNSLITIGVGKGSTKNVTITSSNGIGQQSTRNITVSNITISLVSQSGQPNNSNSHMAIEVSGGSNETDPYTVTVTTVVGIGQNQRKIIRSYNKPNVLFSILQQNEATYPTNTSDSYMGIEVLRGSNKTGPYIVAITTSEGNGKQPTKTTYNVTGLLFSIVSSNGTNNSNSNMNIEVIGGSKKTDPYNVNITTSGGNGQQLTQILESSNADNLTVSLDSLGTETTPNNNSYSLITIGVGKGSTKNVTITSSNGIGQQSTRNITVSNMTISLVSQSGQPNNSNSHMAIEVSGGSNETDPYTVTVTTVVGIGQNQRKIIRSYNKPNVWFSILQQNEATYPTNTSDSYMGIEVLRGSNKTGPYIVAITTSEGNGKQPTKTTYNVSGLLFSIVSSNGTNNSSSNMNIEVIGGSKKTDPYNVNITTIVGNDQPRTEILTSPNVKLSLDSLSGETNPTKNLNSLITIGVGKGSTKNVTITSSNGIGQQSTRNITVSNITISLVSQSGQPNNSNSHMAIEVSGGSNETDPYTVTVTTVVGIGQNQRKIIRSYNKPNVLFSILSPNGLTYPTNTSDSYMGIEVLRGSNKTGPYIVAITTSEGNGKQPTKTTYNVTGLLFSIVSSNGTNNSNSQMDIHVSSGSKKTDPYNVTITTSGGNYEQPIKTTYVPNVLSIVSDPSNERRSTSDHSDEVMESAVFASALKSRPGCDNSTYKWKYHEESYGRDYIPANYSDSAEYTNEEDDLTESMVTEHSTNKKPSEEISNSVHVSSVLHGF